MDFSQFKFTANSRLPDFPTNYDGGKDDDDLKDIREDAWDELQELQERLYAESKQSLLIVLQAMDAAGKDSTIEKLTRNLNAQGCLVHSFKKPSKEELSHDFLWRVHAKAPGQGEITIFNRSHYEDVLVVKVHGWASESQIDSRYTHINAFEALLADRGTRVLKFMLNVSPEYQLSRLRNRLENEDKFWKFNPGDLDERKRWTDYMEAFQQALSHCSSDTSPWYVVPAENRRFRDAMIASVIADTLRDMNPQFPEPEFALEDYPPESIK